MQSKRETGTITYWNEKKKYGFIHPNQAGEDIFFHISSWQSPQLPAKEQIVSFERDIDRKQRPIAVKVQTHSQNSKKKARLFNLFMLSAVILIGSYFSFDIFYNKPQHHSQQELIIETIESIQSNGPFAYPEHDGKTFYNREKKLPERPVGYYREYTVAPKDAKNRGAKRLVTGGDPIEVIYYTEDHYETFIKLEDYP